MGLIILGEEGNDHRTISETRVRKPWVPPHLLYRQQLEPQRWEDSLSVLNP